MLHSTSLNLSHRPDILFLFPFLMMMRERSFEMVKELFVGCGRPRGRSIIRFCLRKVKNGGTGSSDQVLLDATECRASSQFYIVLGESSQLISCVSASLSTFLMTFSRAFSCSLNIVAIDE
jgi:hypothetical protein